MLIPKNGPPTTPGEILLEDYLEPLGITQIAFAARLGVSMQRLNGIVRGKRAVTAETALLLSRELKTTPEFWMNAQAATDIYNARQKLAELKKKAPRAAKLARTRTRTKAKTRPRVAAPA